MDLFIPPESSFPDVLASVALLATLLVAWAITRRALKARDNLSAQVARRWTANVRNALLLIAVVGLLMIWAPQLRTFALSLTAVAVAVVVATKELILCLSGSAFRTFSRAYSIGDIVEIGALRGEVVDINLLSTRLREIERRAGSIRPTGESAVVPHSLLFTQSARLLARDGAPATHGFALVFETDADMFARIEEIRERASAAWRAATGATGDAGRPTVLIGTTDLGRLRLEIEVVARPEDASRVEQAIATAVGSFVTSAGAPATPEPQGG